MTFFKTEASRPRGGIPRGLLETGPIILSYGFRPFFLASAFWAVAAMVLWVGSLFLDVEIAGEYGARAWHAHEMLFGFGSAVLAGFLLTAVPNWTGRLPVSGRPLLLLFLLWAAGRAALLLSGVIGTVGAVVVESLFLPTLLAICVREVVAGKKWADLKVVAGLGALSLANVCFHYETLALGAPDHSPRLAVAAFVMMIAVVGGRMLPSFTRNWLAKAGRTDFPVPYNKFDLAVIVLSLPALALWVAAPDSTVTGVVAGALAVLHGARLRRWRGWTTTKEPLVAVLHVAYGFVPLGFVAIAAAPFGVIDHVAALHVIAIGTVTSMMLAVMTRATRGHTGRELTTSALTRAGYAALFACAVVRPATFVFPDDVYPIYGLAAALWITAFGLFLVEYGPMLVARRRAAGVR